MVLESTVICVDNSEFMRNGDFIPNRLQAQQEAVSLVCHAKLRSNPENNVGLLTLAGHPEVLTTLTTDVGRLLGKLHHVTTDGEMNFLSGLRIAHLALKHRQGKNHKMRIVIFVGSPVDTDEKELVKLAKKLKKEKVNVDVVNFGEELVNTEKLAAFIKTLEGTGSHMVTVPSGSMLSDALFSSPVVMGEDGAAAAAGLGPGFEFGIDPNEDPELALALRVSMEEQRQRQEEEARAASVATAAAAAGGAGETAASSDEEMLEKALALSMESDFTGGGGAGRSVDFAAMTEDEQIQYAMQMSLQAPPEDKGEEEEEPMETDDSSSGAEKAADKK
ncbi:PREDICTED: 26S proteasome non-ATPase regulatory subunit 4-like [Rhagoletis zephyria]|uniref:26S proteasome non-ATPase regulatory subunit 4-like n=1 Tax=Rhagoletis zephyria TaxID=28612 RepID=UPI0008113C4A|nr:PREDICTED: 26S proteasome non-ATPase regulatory subunit 4-like [Rhagoletis zephyria]